jgi:hypothetical protein
MSMPNLSYHVITYDPKDVIDDIDSRICSPKQKFATTPITCGVKWKTYHYTGCKIFQDINLVFQHQIGCHPNGHRRREHLLHFLRVKPRVPASKKKKKHSFNLNISAYIKTTRVYEKTHQECPDGIGIYMGDKTWRKYKVDVSNSVTYLNWTPIFEWYLVWCGSQNGHNIQKPIMC